MEDRHPLLSWKELEALISENKTGVLGRSSETFKKYQAFNMSVRGEYASMRDFVCMALFGMESEVNEQGKKRAKRSSTTNKHTILLLPNEYPYNVASNIEHMVLWSLNNLSNEQVVACVRAMLKKNEKGNTPLFIVFSNPVQSIPDVFHTHVFVNNTEAVA